MTIRRNIPPIGAQRGATMTERRYRMAPDMILFSLASIGIAGDARTPTSPPRGSQSAATFSTAANLRIDEDISIAVDADAP